MSNQIIHVRDMPQHPGAVYIGRSMPKYGNRASKWANPYRIGDNGWDRITVVELYEADLCDGDPENRRVVGRLAELPELRGKTLACWCRHAGEPRTAQTLCHGDVLADLLDRYSDAELIAGDVVWGGSACTWMPPEEEWGDPARMDPLPPS